MAAKKRQVLQQYLPGNFPAFNAKGLQETIEMQQGATGVTHD
jgi:hypothetical protein